MARAIGYRAALQMLVDNGDTIWLKYRSEFPPQTVQNIATIYGKDVRDVTVDLKHMTV